MSPNVTSYNLKTLKKHKKNKWMFSVHHLVYDIAQNGIFAEGLESLLIYLENIFWKISKNLLWLIVFLNKPNENQGEVKSFMPTDYKTIKSRYNFLSHQFDFLHQ